MAVAGAAATAAGSSAPRPLSFDERRAFDLVRRQVALGPRPAGSPASRRLSEILRPLLPRGRFSAVGGGLRNVVGVVPGRDPTRRVLVGAHYDTVDIPGVVGANDGASGVAVVVELARTLRARDVRPTVVFVLFDGEEAPPDSDDFLRDGVRGSRHAARTLARPEAVIVVDMVGDRDLSIPREALSHRGLWTQLRAAARRAGALAVFPPRTRASVLDDHVPFRELGIPAIDVIDFDYDCWHKPCDGLNRVSPRSLDAVGETLLRLLRSL